MPPPGDSAGSSRQPPETRVECSLEKCPSICITLPISPLIDHALEFAHRGKAALVVAAAERDIGRTHRGDRALGFRAGERQRLLAPDRLAGGRHHADLLDMQRMRRGEHNGLHFRVGDRVFEVGGQPEAMLRRQVAREFGLLGHAVHDAQAAAFALNRTEYGLAPAAQTDHGCIDHFCPKCCERLVNVVNRYDMTR